MSDVTRILAQIESGDPLASEQLLPLVYEELRRLAAGKMSRESREHTLQPTALVHEAYLRLVGVPWQPGPPPSDGEQPSLNDPKGPLEERLRPRGTLAGDGGPKWQSRGHFFAAAAEAMRRILIEAARRKASLKRGHGKLRVEFPDDIVDKESDASDSLLALDEALGKLKIEDPDAFQIVMLRHFGGLTVDEAAAALGVSPRTAKRNWSFARAWLRREIEQE